MYNVDIVDRLVGVEIEAVCNHRLWKTEETVGAFTVGTDCSIKPNGREFRFTQPLMPQEAFESIPLIVRHLKSKGAYCNTSTGLHVHVDCPRACRDWLRQNKWRLQEWFRAALRLRAPFARTHLHRKEYANDTVRVDGTGYTSYGSKYDAINVSGTAYTTIEFRMFNCVLNSRYIIGCIKNSLDMANYLIKAWEKETQQKETRHVTV